jgi:hypothetical protein
MKKIIWAAFVCLIMAGVAYAGCDTAKAIQVQGMMHEMATWKNVGKKIEVKWSEDWDQWTPSERTGMITTFANADECISGKARVIEFYRNGKLVGEASPTFGIKLK